MSPKRVLAFRISKYIKTTIILLVSLVVFLVLSKYVHKSFIKLAYLFLILFTFELIIFVFNYIKYLLTLAKYDKQKIENDILNPITFRWEKDKAYVGPDFIVSNKYNLYINRHKELRWIYILEDENKIVGYNNNNAYITIAYIGSKKIGEEIIKKIWNYNPDVLTGYDEETSKRFSNIIKESHHKL